MSRRLYDIELLSPKKSIVIREIIKEDVEINLVDLLEVYVRYYSNLYKSDFNIKQCVEIKYKPDWTLKKFYRDGSPICSNDLNHAIGICNACGKDVCVNCVHYMRSEVRQLLGIDNGIIALECTLCYSK